MERRKAHSFVDADFILEKVREKIFGGQMGQKVNRELAGWQKKEGKIVDWKFA